MKTQILLSRKITGLLLVSALSFTLTACQTTKQASEADRINTALQSVANESSANGNSYESMAALENLYKRDSENPDVAAQYAQALRHNDRLNRAIMILRPFAENDRLNNSAVNAEYAALSAASGNYIDTENYARKVVIEEPESGKGYHLLGIALDAQGKHDQAETAFRKALDYWEGDPSPVLNNLGLNLASQGFFDEALETLRQAAATSSGRDEIERNIRIISTLQSSVPHGATTGRGGSAKMSPPFPGKKPPYNS